MGHGVGDTSPRSPVVTYRSAHSPREPYGQSHFTTGVPGCFFNDSRDAAEDITLRIPTGPSSHHYGRVRISSSTWEAPADFHDGRTPLKELEQAGLVEQHGRLEETLPSTSAQAQSENSSDLLGLGSHRMNHKLRLAPKSLTDTLQSLPEEIPTTWEPNRGTSFAQPGGRDSSPVPAGPDHHNPPGLLDALMQRSPKRELKLRGISVSGLEASDTSKAHDAHGGGSVGPWPGLDDDTLFGLPTTPRIRTTRSEEEEFEPPSTPRSAQRNPAFAAPPSVFAMDPPSPFETEPQSPRPNQMLPPIPRPSGQTSYASPITRFPQNRGQQGAGPAAWSNPFDSGLLSPRHAFSPRGPIFEQRDRTFSESPLRHRSPFASSSSETSRASTVQHFGTFPRMAGPTKQRPSLEGAFDFTDQALPQRVGRPRCHSSEASSGHSTPTVDLKPAQTMDAEAIDKAVDAVLEAPSLPKSGPFRRRWSAPNLAGLAELEERRKHEEAETAANGGPDSPEPSCSEDDWLPQIREDCAFEPGAASGSGPNRAGKRRGSGEEEPPLALRLEFLQGPCVGMVFTTPPGTTEVTLGRSGTNTVEIPLDTISHHHVFIRWDPLQRCWKVNDVGSLNGTTLNNRRISSEQARLRGATCTLKTDDLLELSNSATLKVTVLPGNLMETELSGPKINVYIKPNRNLGPTCTLDPHTLLAMVDDARREAARDVSSNQMAVPELRLHCTTATLTGREHDRLSQGSEDVTAQDLHLPVDRPAALLAVFDGHGGRSAAEQAGALLPGQVRKLMPRMQQGMASGGVSAKLWEEAFLSTDEQIQGDGGCTATALLLWRRSARDDCICLQAANVGDSAAVFVNPETATHSMLTADHRWVNPQEAARVGVGKTQTRMYGLNIARALGDKFLKDKDLGLIAVPHVSQVEQVASSGLVIMASDGLWDVTTTEKVVEVALKAYRTGGKDTCRIAEALVHHARECRTRDDVTVTVVVLDT
eukprot:jgi/Botrbrau1/21476/Bobra.0216s0084.1